MRFAICFSLALLLITDAAPALSGDKGVMEKTGDVIGKAVETTKDFFSDSAITAKVKTRLLKDDYVSGFDIKIKTTDGECVVGGEVESEKLAKRVMDIVRATRGVKRARSEILIVTRTHFKVE